MVKSLGSSSVLARSIVDPHCNIRRDRGQKRSFQLHSELINKKKQFLYKILKHLTEYNLRSFNSEVIMISQ